MSKQANSFDAALVPVRTLLVKDAAEGVLLISAAIATIVAAMRYRRLPRLAPRPR